MSDFFNGMIAMGYAVVALFFARFWGRTRDGLFAIFAAAFVLMAVSTTLAALLGLKVEERSGLYLLRALAFALIIGGILVKNVGGRGGE